MTPLYQPKISRTCLERVAHVTLLRGYYGSVWERDANRVPKKFKFFLLKFNIICMFWIVLMC